MQVVIHHVLLQTHLAAKGLLNIPFPYYNKLAYVFGRDRAMDRGIETFVDVRSNGLGGYKRFQMLDGNDMEIPTMYSQGFDMSQDDVRISRLGRASDGRTESSGLKQKRRGQ